MSKLNVSICHFHWTAKIWYADKCFTIKLSCLIFLWFKQYFISVAFVLISGIYNTTKSTEDGLWFNTFQLYTAIKSWWKGDNKILCAMGPCLLCVKNSASNRIQTRTATLICWATWTSQYESLWTLYYLISEIIFCLRKYLVLDTCNATTKCHMKLW